ncbi:MAG: Mrp/NBP35 family ATP-binding protein [Firmicutes bacterium]|nr:Mrp/NBP35 family ATP-binding protein [Bacillota bacterium]
MTEENKVQEQNPETCTHNCSSCGSACASRDSSQPAPKEALHKLSTVRKVIAVVSGKGGVGKSLVTSMMTVQSHRLGQRVAVMDADITGPSIPKCFGVEDGARAVGMGLLPAKTDSGIQLMSTNLLLEDKESAVIWRGSVISGVVKQFWSDVIWTDVDAMFIDMPPGTGDVPLTVYQAIPVDGIIIVTSPQELVSMIVAKAVNMAKKMNVPILGIVENMSYIECPDCGKQMKVFGESHVEEVAAKYDLKVLGRIPLNPELAALCDAGRIEDFEGDYLIDAAKEVAALPIKEKK